MVRLLQIYCSDGSAGKDQRPLNFYPQILRTATPSRRPPNIEIWGCKRNMSKAQASVLRDTESKHLVTTTICHSSDKECLLNWLGELRMSLTNDSLNALIYSSGILIANTVHRHLVVDLITFQVLQQVLVPSNTPSVMDVQTHLLTLRLSCHHEQSILRINFQPPTQYISHIQETLLISTNRVSIPLPSQDQLLSQHNLCPLTVRYLRLFRLSQSNPEHTHDQWKWMSRP